MEKNGLKLLIMIFVIVILPVGVILYFKMEGEKPSLVITPPITGIGISQTLNVSVSDAKSGMRRIRIDLVKDGRETVLLKKEFPSGGIFGGDRVHKAEFEVPVQPRTLGITDGRGVLRMVARDYSWRGWWNGNKTLIEKDIVVDTRRPRVDVLSGRLNIRQGGAGLLIYRVSEPCPENGVYVGENFFPGYSAENIIEGDQASDVFMAFIGMSYKQGADTLIFIKAVDPAGNITRADFSYYIGSKSFKKDVINISDRFLNWKMPEFVFPMPGIEMRKNPPESSLEKFLIVNNKLREANYRRFVEIGKKSDNVLHWKGRFESLPKAARMASFADHREYRHNGRSIDNQVHMGIDMASIKHAPVPAANSGKVAFAGEIGIYGQTVMIDHGLGLFSTYSHLSDFRVKEGDMVSKGDIIGSTGKTGLAGGDHLHFGILIHNTFVNPIEWLDGAWIRNNITNKIRSVKREA